MTSAQRPDHLVFTRTSCSRGSAAVPANGRKCFASCFLLDILLFCCCFLIAPGILFFAIASLRVFFLAPPAVLTRSPDPCRCYFAYIALPFYLIQSVFGLSVVFVVLLRYLLSTSIFLVVDNTLPWHVAAMFSLAFPFWPHFRVEFGFLLLKCHR